jgi:site-specific DNA-methyltransferase (adenine-specific)
VLFKAPSGEQSQAQIEAFEDTWHWNESAERAFGEVVTGPHSDATIMLKAMRSALGENDMTADLAMMAVRLIELHRVLKPTGSLYLHCDPTASHYLKILLDAIFGPTQFRNEIVWQRTSSHNDPKTIRQDTRYIHYYSINQLGIKSLKNRMPIFLMRTILKPMHWDAIIENEI